MPGLNTKGERLAWDADYKEYAGHPRAAGTHAKVLRMSRENGVPLMHALSQLSYWHAKHLGDTGLKDMQVRGCMQEGMVADIVIFDPQAIVDKATYEEPRYSEGIHYVLVNGELVLADGVLTDARPGMVVRGRGYRK